MYSPFALPGTASLRGEELPSAAPASIPLLGGETLIKPAAAGTDTIVVGINTGTSGAGPTIPQGFLGTSHEWGRLADYCNSEVIPGAWMNIFKNLGPRAVLRVGGFSTEALTDVSYAVQRGQPGCALPVCWHL
jgi:hypothetical protein